MSIRKRIILGAAAAATALGAAVLTAVPANAAPANCPSSYACTWGDVGYATNNSTAGVIKFQRYIPWYGDYYYTNTGVNGNDTASSVFNNGVSETAYFYVDINRRGSNFPLSRGQGDSNLHDSAGAVQGGFQDRVSSAYFDSFNNDNNK